MSLVGANRSAEIAGIEQLAGRSHYLIGNDAGRWRTGIANYAKVRSGGVYPGVDLIYYGNQRQLEYDFIVSPGADPHVIRLVFDEPARGRPTPLRIDAAGDLVLKMPGGEIRWQKPHGYQIVGGERRDVAAGYVPKGRGQFGFQVAHYDRTQPLIIDPVLSYSTYLGGTGYDYANSIAVDSSGNAYVTGFTYGFDFPAMGAFQSSNRGAPEAFVAKVNAAGTALVYSTYLGGSGEDYGLRVRVNAAGNAYVAGYTNSVDFPTAHALQGSSGGGYDAFLTQLDPSGSGLVYSTYLGGNGDDYAYGLALDSSGAAYLAGFTSSMNFPVSPRAVQTAYGSGAYKAFVSKVSADGSTLVYSSYLGGEREDYAAGIAVDASQAAYVTGYTNSVSFPTVNAFQPALGGGPCGGVPCFDAFVTKLNPSGSAILYSTYLGGSGGDYGYDLAVDSGGNTYVTGYTTSTHFPVTTGAFQRSNGGGYDAFVTKINPAGSGLLYSTYLGGLGAETAYGIAVDSAGQAAITGYTGSANFPLASPVQSASGGLHDVFVTKLDALGSTLLLSTYLGGSLYDYGRGIAVDSSGNIHVAGGTFSTDFPTTPGVLQRGYGDGAYDAFITKITDPRRPVASLSVNQWNFLPQRVATSSAPQPITLANNGDAPLSIQSISVSGDFSQTNNCGSSLNAGGSCTINVTFTPTMMGYRSGLLAITDNASGSPHTVSLSGTGAMPMVSLSPASLAFGSQTVGATSEAQTVTLANTGNVSLHIISLAVSGDYAQANNCGDYVIPGGECAIHVTFTPTVEGSRSGTLTVIDDAPGSPHVVALAGTGVPRVVHIRSLTFDPNELLGRSSGTGTLTLEAVAPTGGVAVSLASDNATLQVPAGVIVPSGSAAVSFAVTSGPVANPVRVTITASSGTSTQTGTLTLIPRAPSISHLSPPKSKVSHSGLTLTVTGDDFSLASVVRWNGSARPTRFDSLTQLTAEIAAADLDHPGAGEVTVFTPSPGGGLSNTLHFTVGCTENDFDGDGKTDFAVWQPATQTWNVAASGAAPETLTRQLGAAADVLVPGDYDGDGRTDFAIWRPRGGWWYTVSSTSGTLSKLPWGQEGDIPVPGDYDGDGTMDPAFWRRSNGHWYILRTSDPDLFFAQEWGVAGDVPVLGDFDGDGKTDQACWRPGNGTWYIIPSSDPQVPLTVPWGETGDVPVPGDYDGDGKADVAVWRRADGTWYVRPSSAPEPTLTRVLGTSADIPVPGDYDGDGRTDFAVRSRQTSRWMVVRAADGTTWTRTVGGTGDRPATLLASILPMLQPMGGANFDGGRKAEVAVWRPADGSWTIVPINHPDARERIVWGARGDVPVPGDYDGDGTADLAYWRPSNGHWHIRPSSSPDNPVEIVGGISGDIPVPADYDGDGKTDAAFWRPSTGHWYVRASGSPGTFVEQVEGASGDVPVPADYDGDGKADLALWRPAEGRWYIPLSSDLSATDVVSAGASGDVPVPGDYDGDGKADVAYWRPSEGRWVVIPSTNPDLRLEQQLGASGDIPVPKDYDGDGRIDFAVYRPANATWYIIPSASPWARLEIQCGGPGDVPVNKPPGP
jgi:hypothetical protein